MKNLFESRLDAALKRVDPELNDFLRPNVVTRARCATVLANAHIRAARRNRVAVPRAFVELLQAAAVWSDPYPRLKSATGRCSPRPLDPSRPPRS